MKSPIIFLAFLIFFSIFVIQESIANQPSESLWPKTTLDTPSQVLIGKPFNVTFSYTFLEFKEDGTVDEISEDHDKSRISILIEISDGMEILSAPGFVLSEERTDRYNFTVHDYQKTVLYDDMRIMNETFTFQVNEPMRFPYNRIGIWADSTPRIRYLDYQDNAVIILDKEVYPDVGEELIPIPFEGVTFPLDEEQQRNPAFIDSLEEFLKNNISVANMTEYLQNAGVSEIIIEELQMRHPDLFEPKTWYVGEGLKKGDYFSYDICNSDYKNCTKIQMDFWIKNEIQQGQEKLWVTKYQVTENDKIENGTMYLGKILPEPISVNYPLDEYQKAYKHSLIWLGAFVTPNGEGKSLEPFTNWQTRENGQWGTIKRMGEPINFGPTEKQIIIISGNETETTLVSWNYNNSTNKIWILDDFPFPVKAEVFNPIFPEPPLEYEFELLDYKQNITENPFSDSESSLLRNCTIGNYFGSFALGSWSIRVQSNDDGICKFDYTWELEGGYTNYECMVLTDKIKITNWNSSAIPIEKEILDNFCEKIKEGNFFLDQKQNKQISDGYLSPLRQIKEGINSEDVKCKDEFRLIFKTSDNSPACVKPESIPELIDRGWANG